MGGSPFYYDAIYWILLIPVLILSFYAQIKVSSTFKRYSSQPNRRQITGSRLHMKSCGPTASVMYKSVPAGAV